MEYCFRYYLNKVEVSLYIIEWTNIFTINIEYWMSLFHTTYTFILNKDKILEKNSPLPATRIWVQLACYIRQHYTLLTFILQIFNCSIKHRAGFWFPSVCFLIVRFFFFCKHDLDKRCLWCCSNITIHVCVCMYVYQELR